MSPSKYVCEGQYVEGRLQVLTAQEGEATPEAAIAVFIHRTRTTAQQLKVVAERGMMKAAQHFEAASKAESANFEVQKEPEQYLCFGDLDAQDPSVLKVFRLPPYMHAKDIKNAGSTVEEAVEKFLKKAEEDEWEAIVDGVKASTSRRVIDWGEQ